MLDVSTTVQETEDILRPDHESDFASQNLASRCNKLAFFRFLKSSLTMRNGYIGSTTVP
jgi:hypothetical protein